MPISTQIFPFVFSAIVVGSQGGAILPPNAQPQSSLNNSSQINNVTSNKGDFTLIDSDKPDTHFYGMCDASGAVPIDQSRFMVADDEDNVLRFYDAASGGKALKEFDVSPALSLLPAKPKPNKVLKAPDEMDIEAATQVGPYAYWLTSHGRNKKGKFKPARFHLFATELVGPEQELSVVGNAYTDLIVALNSDPRFSAFNLVQAAQLPPKTPGGLNIEGMTARAEGGVWIGLRNPTFNGKALVFSLNNPQAVLSGAAPLFGDPLLLDLDGGGVRALSSWQGKYLVVGGSQNGNGDSALYVWDSHQQTLAKQLTFKPMEFNPEAFFTPEQGSQMLLISDDGNREINGLACKDLTDPKQKYYRGRWLQLKLQPI